jgi:probable HAF family extracellular repeat protein
LRWIGDGGAEDLGSLLGESGMSAAIRVSGDGRVIAGVSDSTEGERAVRWVDGAIENLGTVDGYEASWGRGTNADGSAIVGFVRNGDDHFAMYWSEATGMVELNSYLPSIGIDLLGWVLTDTVDVSADGRTLLGLAQYQGLVRSWSVTIPSPGVSGLMAVAGIACARRRR